MTIEFNCPNCNKLLRTSDDKAGKRAKCPDCSTAVTVPQPRAAHDDDFDLPVAAGPDDEFSDRAAPSRPGSDTKTCPVCGGTIKAAATRCKHCGEELGGGEREQLSGPQKIDAGDVVSTSWEIFKSQMGMIIGGVLLMVIIGFAINFAIGFVLGGLASAMGRDAQAMINIMQVPIQIISWAIGVYLQTGQAIFLLKIARGEPAEIGDLFKSGPYILRALGNSFLFFVMVFLGTLACIVPGVILALMFWPYIYVLVDTDARGIDCLARAKDITSGNWGAIFVLCLAYLGLFMLGVLACLVGLFFTVPLGTFMFAVAYCRMTGQPTARI